MRIAFVEDNEVFELNYGKWLSALFPKAEIDAFRDASDETAQALVSGRYTLVILDVQLGRRRLGGRSLAKTLYGVNWSADNPKPAVVVLTATIEPELVPEILNLGVSVVRGKPLSITEMREVLQKVSLPSTNDGTDPDREIEVILTAQRNNVRFGKKEGTLSPLPLRIFDRLLLTPGMLVNYAEIQRVTGVTAMSRESIQQHIAAIRIVLKDRFEFGDTEVATRLVAEPGRGYIWMPRQKQSA